jgi:hypothetical protein
MKTAKILSAVVLGSVLGTSAYALTDGPYSDTIVTQNTNFTLSFSIPKFNSGLGTLDSITYTLTGNVLGDAKFENQDGSPATVTMAVQAILTLKRPDLSTIDIMIPAANTSDNVTAFDTVLDYGGTSGKTYTGLSDSHVDGPTVLSSGADLALFTGAGNILLPFVASGASTGSGGGNLALVFATQAGGSISVTYTYHNDVPEPKVYGAIGAVACLGLLGYRRYRTSRQA